VSRAVVIATGVTATGDREVLGADVGDSEDGAFWTAFLKGLRARGRSVSAHLFTWLVSADRSGRRLRYSVAMAPRTSRRAARRAGRSAASTPAMAPTTTTIARRA
jgi:hypothetical protein